jgi:hypothetical protein
MGSAHKRQVAFASGGPCAGIVAAAVALGGCRSTYEALSGLASPEIDAKARQISSYHSHGMAGAVHTYTRYRFAGREIEKVWESEQDDDMRPPGKVGGASDVVFHRTVRALRRGTMQVLREGFVSYETDEVLALVRGDRLACKE